MIDSFLLYVIFSPRFVIRSLVKTPRNHPIKGGLAAFSRRRFFREVFVFRHEISYIFTKYVLERFSGFIDPAYLMSFVESVFGCRAARWKYKGHYNNGNGFILLLHLLIGRSEESWMTLIDRRISSALLHSVVPKNSFISTVCLADEQRSSCFVGIFHDSPNAVRRLNDMYVHQIWNY